jgi:hypothetical protein
MRPELRRVKEKEKAAIGFSIPLHSLHTFATQKEEQKT